MSEKIKRIIRFGRSRVVTLPPHVFKNEEYVCVKTITAQDHDVVVILPTGMRFEKERIAPLFNQLQEMFEKLRAKRGGL